MGFKDIKDFLSSGVDLPYDGKVYHCPEVTAETGIFVQTVLSIQAKLEAGGEISEDDKALLNMDDDEEKDFNRLLLGGAYDEMRADKVPFSVLNRARSVVIAKIQGAPDLVLEAIWEGRSAEGKAPKRPTDRQPKTQKSNQSSGTRKK